MIGNNGWLAYSIWEHSAQLKELYKQRCLMLAEEMTCAVQAAELLIPHVSPGDTVLDVGCGSGYFYHSLRNRQIPVSYYGIDAAPSLIAIGRKYLPAYGLPPERLHIMRIEDMEAKADHVICMNVLSNMDNYHRPLERILQSAQKTVIIRESCKDEAEYKYVHDDFLDEGCDLKVYVNAYAKNEFMSFIESYGFKAEYVEDRYTSGRPQMVIGHSHYWSFFVAEKL
jgi:ubiquinone/menaquinone biosynthesis C-methylase UbiE